MELGSALPHLQELTSFPYSVPYQPSFNPLQYSLKINLNTFITCKLGHGMYNGDTNQRRPLKRLIDVRERN